MNALRRTLALFLEQSKLSFRLPPWSPALSVAPQSEHQDLRSQPGDSFLNDLKDGILRAVQTNRRSVERRRWRRIGMPQFQSTPRRDLKCCVTCGHYHEAHTLCGHCYAEVKAEAQVIKEAMTDSYGRLEPIEHDVLVKYEGETVPEAPRKKIIEIPKKRPSIFSQNLLEKENQV